MKRSILILVSAIVLLAPAVAYSYDTPGKGNAPPVSQNLVREGDYSVKLAAALKLGKAQDETTAISTLAASGIAPRNGWIADFPVTPDIIADIDASIVTASDAGKLPMGGKDSHKALLALNKELGLDVNSAASGEKGKQASTDTAVINNYYYDEGPPVVTYYPPPPDYYYLYAWDPFPFWCGRFFFPGFFVLANFSFPVIVSSAVIVSPGFVFISGTRVFVSSAFVGSVVITNHFTVPGTRTAVLVDPVTKSVAARTAFRAPGAWSPKAAAHAPSAVALKTAAWHGSVSSHYNKESAGNIVRHGATIVGRTSNGTAWRHSAPSGGRTMGSAPSRGGRTMGSAPSRGGRTMGSAPSRGGRTMGSAPMRGGSNIGSAPMRSGQHMGSSRMGGSCRGGKC